MIPGEAQTMVMAQIARVVAAFAVAALEDYRPVGIAPGSQAREGSKLSDKMSLDYSVSD